MKINTFFNIIGGKGKYTEAYIEKNHGEYPLISGQTVDGGIIGYIDTYDFDFDDCLTYTKDGEKSGTIFQRSGKFSLTSHANALIPKKKYKGKIILEWFKYKYEPIFKSKVIGRFGVPSLPQSILKTIDVFIPSKKIQQVELKAFKEKTLVISRLKDFSFKLQEKITDLQYSIIKIPDNKTVKTIYGKDLFNILEKNSGITEKFIYDNFNPTINQLPIYNGSENIWGFIPKTALIEDKKALKISKGNFMIIVRKGVNAGHIFFQNKYNESIIAEDAIPITFKKEYENKVDIHWFIREYSQIFRKTAIGKFSSATFSNTLLEKMIFKIPDKSFQKKCSKLYQDVDTIIEKLNSYLVKVNKEIVNLENSIINS